MIRTSVLALFVAVSCGLANAAEKEWTSLFNGKNLEGWKASEAKDSFTVEDGAIVAKGNPRSHLFYVGNDKPYQDFELMVDVMTKPGANGGIYFHSQYQEEGWPKYGYEVQVNNTHRDPKKTGSLYAVENVMKAPAEDNEWFTVYVKVEGKNVLIKVNDKVTVNYDEPEGKKAGKDFTRVLDKGTFALQAHDPNSVVMFKNIKVRRLD